MSRAVAIDLDGALGDTRPLWTSWLADAARLLPVEPASLPEDRVAAASALDAAGAGNWRTLLERFAEDRAAVFLRPHAGASDALRRLAAGGTRIGLFTDAPDELARVAARQLGAARRAEALETGADALARLVARLGADASVITTREALVEAART